MCSSDLAVFSGAREDYLITSMGSGQYVVEHLNGGDDGMNLVEGIENFQFADGVYDLDDMLATNPQSDTGSLTYDITIDAGLTDTDGSESLSDVTITGVPSGATFSAGTHNDDGSWTMTANDLDGLTLNVTDGVSADFSLSVSVTSTEANGGDTATSTSTIDVGLPDGWGSGDAASASPDTSSDALDPLATMFTDSDTLTFEGKEYDISDLTAGDSKGDYGDVAPLGSKAEIDGYNPNDGDTSDGYSSTDGGDNGVGGDIDNT